MMLSHECELGILHSWLRIEAKDGPLSCLPQREAIKEENQAIGFRWLTSSTK